MTPRVVLDTNVVVSALVFPHRRLAWLRHAWMAARCRPLSSRATVDEILRVLCYPKFRLTAADIEVLLADYVPFVEPVDIPRHGIAVPEPPDRDDRIFLELAAAGKAEFLVSGDRGVLGMRSVGTCRILTPGEFRAMSRVGRVSGRSASRRLRANRRTSNGSQ